MEGKPQLQIKEEDDGKQVKDQHIKIHKVIDE